MKPLDHQFQRAEPTEYSELGRNPRYILGKDRRVRFSSPHCFEKERVIKTGSESPEKQNFCQTEAIFQHMKAKCATVSQ